MNVKYIVTRDMRIIVFPPTFNHSDFARFNPVSAGFIWFGVDREGNPKCTCDGESISLGLKSQPERDTELAMRQLKLDGSYF